MKEWMQHVYYSPDLNFHDLDALFDKRQEDIVRQPPCNSGATAASPDTAVNGWQRRRQWQRWWWPPRRYGWGTTAAEPSHPHRSQRHADPPLPPASRLARQPRFGGRSTARWCAAAVATVVPCPPTRCECGDAGRGAVTGGAATWRTRCVRYQRIAARAWCDGDMRHPDPGTG